MVIKERVGSWLRFEGAVTSGLGEGRRFVQLDWVKDQVSRELGFVPYPGTFNVKVANVSGISFLRSVMEKGIRLVPPGRTGCFGYCFIAKIAKQVEGAVIIPSEGGHRDQLELISSVKVVDALRLSDGDSLQVDVYVPIARTELLVEAVIFDMDGTILNTFEDYHSSLQIGLADYSLSVSRPSLASMLSQGLSLDEIIERASLAKYSEEEVKRLVVEARKKTQDAYMKIAEKCPQLIDGAREAVERLARTGVPIGLATSSKMPKSRVEDILSSLGLLRYMKSTICGRDVDAQKPSPDTIILCARGLNVPMRRCLAVGDSVVDVEAGRRAGAITASVLTGVGDRRSLEQEKPDFIANDLPSLVKMLFDGGMIVPPLPRSSHATVT